jgi:hypothetical protein
MYILNSSQQLHFRNLRTSAKMPFIIQRRAQTRPEFTMARTSLLVVLTWVVPASLGLLFRNISWLRHVIFGHGWLK